MAGGVINSWSGWKEKVMPRVSLIKRLYDKQ